jgi:hypothetical protein
VNHRAGLEVSETKDAEIGKQHAHEHDPDKINIGTEQRRPGIDPVRSGILPTLYLENVRDYVRGGGAVLFAAGPAFASADTIYRSPLAEIIPARPTARVVEEAFLEANPDWTADMLTITCQGGRIAEARLCLTKDLRPRPCGADVARDCRMEDARLDPIR